MTWLGPIRATGPTTVDGQHQANQCLEGHRNEIKIPNFAFTSVHIS